MMDMCNYYISNFIYWSDIPVPLEDAWFSWNLQGVDEQNEDSEKLAKSRLFINCSINF